MLLPGSAGRGPVLFFLHYDIKTPVGQEKPFALILHSAHKKPIFRLKKERIHAKNAQNAHGRSNKKEGIKKESAHWLPVATDWRSLSMSYPPPSRVSGKLKPCYPGRCPRRSFTAPSVRTRSRQVNRNLAGGRSANRCLGWTPFFSCGFISPLITHTAGKNKFRGMDQFSAS